MSFFIADLLICYSKTNICSKPPAHVFLCLSFKYIDILYFLWEENPKTPPVAITGILLAIVEYKISWVP